MARLLANYAGGASPRPLQSAGCVTVISTYTVLLTDYVVLVNVVSVVISLPAISDAVRGHQFVIKAMLATPNCTVDADGTDTIDGQTTFSLSTQYQSVTVFLPPTGTDWVIL